MGLKVGGVVFYENKMNGCLESINNVCENLMNMMQNLCQKDPPKTPHLVSSTPNHKIPCVVKTFHIAHPQRLALYPHLYMHPLHVRRKVGIFFVSLGV